MVSKSQIETRLRELRKEQERGHSRLAQLEREREQLRETLLRINGAIQVLDELRNQTDSLDERTLDVSDDPSQAAEA